MPIAQRCIRTNRVGGVGYWFGLRTGRGGACTYIYSTLDVVAIEGLNEGSALELFLSKPIFGSRLLVIRGLPRVGEDETIEDLTNVTAVASLFVTCQRGREVRWCRFIVHTAETCPWFASFAGFSLCRRYFPRVALLSAGPTSVIPRA